MKENKRKVEDAIAGVPESSWKYELEKTSGKYHHVAAWAAIIFDPLFAITDYFNIRDGWIPILWIRIAVSLMTLATLGAQKRYNFPSYIIVIVPFLLISLQNAITYNFITNEHLLGHNLNYMALLIGAAMFLAWESIYSIGAIVISICASAVFIKMNPGLSIDKFFVNGGLLLIAVAAFMYALIKTRYNLTVKEIKARLALQISNEEIQARNEEIQMQNEEIQAQAEKIIRINDSLEQLVQERTEDLQRKNTALEEAAFINAHKLRRPVASILGLANLVSKLELNDDGRAIVTHLKTSTEELDTIVGSISRTIEKANHPVNVS